MEHVLKNLVNKTDIHKDDYFELESLIIVKKVINLNSYDGVHQFNLELIKLILENKYSEVERLLSERKKEIAKEFQKEMEK